MGSIICIWVGNTVNDILCYVAALFFRCHLTPHLNYVVDWFSELVSSISSSAVRGSDAIRRYQSWKIEARLTLIGSTVIFHCHSSRRKKDLTKKTFGTITICHLLLMMIVCNEAGIFDQLWKLLFGDDLIRKKRVSLICQRSRRGKWSVHTELFYTGSWLMTFHLTKWMIIITILPLLE